MKNDNDKRFFLETQRLVLKMLAPSDLNALIQLRTHPEVMRYIGEGRIQTKEQIEHFLAAALAYQEKHSLGFCSVFEKTSGNFIGQAGLFHLGFDDTQQEIELAYRLLPNYWGKGYATDLAKALVDWGFTHLPVNKLVAATHLDNIASQQVLKKAGFIDVGLREWYSKKQVRGFEVYRNDAIEIVPYDSAWPKLAEKEIATLKTILPSACLIDIQHVGSTAVSGLSAKPIIDIQIAVTSLPTIKPLAIEQLKNFGYVFWDENPEHDRLFFVKGMPPYGEKRTHHVHIVEPNSKHWREKLAFRDYLRSHPDAAHAYQQLKMQLMQQYRYDREAYTQAKTEFIQASLMKAKAEEKN